MYKIKPTYEFLYTKKLILKIIINAGRCISEI